MYLNGENACVRKHGLRQDSSSGCFCDQKLEDASYKRPPVDSADTLVSIKTTGDVYNDTSSPRDDPIRRQ